MKNKPSNYKTGHFCETLAQVYLMFKGYLPVAKNYVVGRGTGAGEIDLIMKKGNTLVLIEVKKRPSYSSGLHAISIENQTRIVRSSAAFLGKHPRYAACSVRYDAVVLTPWSWPKHLKEAWRVL